MRSQSNIFALDFWMLELQPLPWVGCFLSAKCWVNFLMPKIMFSLCEFIGWWVHTCFSKSIAIIFFWTVRFLNFSLIWVTLSFEFLFLFAFFIIEFLLSSLSSIVDYSLLFPLRIFVQLWAYFSSINLLHSVSFC